MTSFVTRRPSIQLGTQIADFPPVSRPLHCDENSEVYLLEKYSDHMLVVLLYLPQDGESLAQVESSLKRWWALVPQQSIKCEYIDHFSSSDGREYFRAIIRVFGDWAVDCDSASSQCDDFALREMLGATLSICDVARKSDQCPVFILSLVWLRKVDGYVLAVPLIATPWSADRETYALRDLIWLNYYVIAGIEPSDSGVHDRSVSLTSWAKNVCAETSRLLARCLLPNRNSGSIIKFADLSSALQEDQTGKRQQNSAARTGKLHGLEKVAGMHALKSLLQEEVIKPLREPEAFEQYGLTVPNGMLLFGPPGCGKTYVSKQLAEELGFYYIEVIPSEVAGSYVHQTVLKIRDVFERAEEMAPSVIFIDEFEALVPPRSELGGHQQYKSEEVNELLVQLGSCAERNIFLIAATNEPHKIDVAVRRTGRLDKLIYVGPPDEEARSEMLTLYLSNRPTADDVDIASLASVLNGYSASDIKFLVDEAARLALRQDRSPITMELLHSAIKRVPPSILPDDELRYQSFVQRGT